MASGSQSLYSQACNFNSFLEKGVDPRTGQYTCSIDVYNAPAQVRNCPVFKLSLNFSPLSAGDLNFGKGWSLNLPYYDKAAGTIVASTGEQYRVTETNQFVALDDQKLESFQFKRETVGNEVQYQFIYKSGQVEVLSRDHDRYDRAALKKLYSPSGRAFEFDWEPYGNGGRRLKKVTDEMGTLIEVNYPSQTSPLTSITTAPNTAASCTYSLSIENDRLRYIELPAADKPRWTFDYDTYGPLLCLVKVVSPSGLMETMTYVEHGHQLPSGAPHASIPYVSSHTAWPAQGQPTIVTTYEYPKGNNFLGYGSGQGWSENGDNLYLARSTYNYSAEVTVGGKKTRYTYNKYHLMTESRQVKGTKSVVQETVYYAKTDKSFAEQEAYFQLPERVVTTYSDEVENKPRQEETRYKYDKAGNPVSETGLDGLVITREYYDSKGEKDRTTGSSLCPADPHGFQRYLKEETVTPAPSAYSTPIRRQSYTYLQLPTVAGAPKDYFVAAEEERGLHERQVVTRTEYRYVNQTSSRDHGRLSQQVDEIFGKYPVTHSWAYSYGSDRLTQAISSKTSDNLTVEHKASYSLLSGLEMTHTSQSGATNNFDYDVLGRLTTVTASPGTAYQTTRSQSYSRVKDGVGYCLEVTDGAGVKTRYFTDGLERVVRVEKQDGAKSQTFRRVQERSYNNLAQCIQAVEVDWLRTAGQPSEQRTVRDVEYDDWGQVCRVVESGSAAVCTVMDPVTLTKTEGLEGEGKTRSVLNTRRAVTSKTLLTKHGKVYSTISYSYDGLGRQVEEKDHLGRTTQYQRDYFDRITKVTWPNGRVTHNEYSLQSVSILPTSVKLGAHQLGAQSFDGLDRITSTTSGGRTKTNKFQDVHAEPYQVVLPTGHESTIDYEPELNYAVTKLRGQDQENVFDFDKQTGALMLLQNAHTTHRLQHDDSGRVSREQMTLHDTGETYAAEYAYSMAGRLQSYTDVHGQRWETAYNSRGEAKSLTQGELVVGYEYDGAHRLSKSSATMASNSKGLTTQLEHDDFGRVTERIISLDKTVLRKLVQTYGPTGLIDTRRLTDGSGGVLKSETFEYDAHNRLVGYMCGGSEPPVDEHGRRLQSQKFMFDEFDNIKQVVTGFQDGTENTASYGFSDKDPTQLVTISNTHADVVAEITLDYDDNGSLTRDERGRKLRYDTLNRISEVQDPDGTVLCQYCYDAAGKLVTQKRPGQPDTHLFYRGNSIVALEAGEQRQSFISDGEQYWGQTVQERGTTASQVWASDEHQTVLAWLEADKVYHETYTPYGFSPLDGPAMAFNGQWRDPVTGWYHLGNGYRVYNPVLMRFHTPDPWSPFTSGEINPYAYCLGDPINRVDPSGHFSLFGINFGWKDLVMMVVGIVVGTVAAVATGGAALPAVLTAGAKLAIQMGVSIASGVLADVVTSLTYDWIADVDIEWEQLGINAAIGALTGAFFGLGGELVSMMRKPIDEATKTLTKVAAEGAISEGVGRMGSWLMVGGMTKGAEAIKALGQEQSDADSGNKHRPGPGGAEAEAGSGLPEATAFQTRDSIRPALKDGQYALGYYKVQHESAGVFAAYGARPNAGQSVAHLLNRDLRSSYGNQAEKLPHGLGPQHHIRSLHDSIRHTVRQPHRAADWNRVPGLGSM